MRGVAAVGLLAVFSLTAGVSGRAGRSEDAAGRPALTVEIPEGSPPAAGPRAAAAQRPDPSSGQSVAAEHPGRPGGSEQASLREAAVALPLAAGLSALLAFRPRRRHAPPRSPEVIQTQIMLGLVGAVVMLIVGASLARAFGIVGAASLVRYRAKVSDPKDASVMLSALGIGLATGVGLFWLAAVATTFTLAVLWALEWLEPLKTVPFALTVKGPVADLRPRIERLLRRRRLEHQLRASSPEEVSYEVELPLGFNVESISDAIMAADPEHPPAVEWQEKD